jgi:hypothetical protein
MDFSNFNGSEQAHMTKVIEKKQVGVESCGHRGIACLAKNWRD